MANKEQSAERERSGLTRPGELYFPGDALPQPDVVEKNSDSVCALWSDVVEGESAGEDKDKSQGETNNPPDKDFVETVPIDLDAMALTQSMDLPELPKDDKK